MGDALIVVPADSAEEKESPHSFSNARELANNLRASPSVALAEVVGARTLAIEIEFDDEDPLNRLDRETVRADHVFPQAEIKVESEVLDFSFMKIEDIESIKRKEP